MTSRIYKKGLIALLISAFALAGCGPKGETTSDKRTAIREMKNSSIQELIQQKPEAQRLLDTSAGYAVFSNKNAKFFLAGGGAGYGVAIDRISNKETFMKMAQVSAGLGLGVTDLRAVFIFQDQAKFNRFLTTGWEFGGDADIAATSEETGGVSANINANLNQDPIVYEFTKNGIALIAGIAGTRYWPNDDLNY